MNQVVDKNKISLIDRMALLRSFPCFASLTDQQSEALCGYMKEVSVSPQDKIVVENDLVDSVYMIVSGSAEVTRSVSRRKKKSEVPVAVLSQGEAIGLNDTGFYSSTGQRMATVTATTAMLLLKVDLKDLHAFLKENNLELAMADASVKMLRMHFIKQSMPFAKLSHARLQWLADKVEDETIEAGTLLFNQGDEADKCYLIRSGEIDIFTKDEANQEKSLAHLQTSVLFGEATLITNAKRNASAKALVKTELLVLSYKHLSELLESERNTANMFMTLMVDRSRPVQNTNVTVHERMTADGQKLIILKNSQTGSYFKLSEEGAFIWKNLDGKHTLQEITLDIAEEFKIFAPDVVAGVISKLTKSGFITNLILDEEAYHGAMPKWKKILSIIPRILGKRIAFGDSDKWVTSLYEKYIHYLLTLPAKILLTGLLLSGFIAFIIQTPNVLLFFNFKHVSLFLTLGLIPLSGLKVILHELGHAFAVKAFGREIHYIGVGLNGMSLMAFADTSDMWLAQRRPRMLVNLAGVYMDLISAGICSLLTFCTVNPYLQGMLWLFALYTYIGGFAHLNPTQDTDGYFALMDALEKNRLRHLSVAWLVKKFPQALKHPALFLKNKAEVIYWLACILYLLSVTLLTYMIQAFIFTVIGIETSNPYLGLALPFFATVVSSVGIFMEVRKEAG